MSSLSLLVGDHSDLLRKRNFQILLLANLLPPLGSSLLSPVLDSLVDPFGVSPSKIGLMISVFSAPAIVLIPIAGLLSDYFGRKPILIVGLLIFGAGGTMIAFTTDYNIVLGLRLLQGVGFASTTSIIITSLGDLYSGTEEATAQGIRFTGSGISQTVFPLVSGVLVSIAWEYPFFIYALSFPVAVTVYLWFNEPVNKDDLGKNQLRADRREYLVDLFGVVRRKEIIGLLLARATPPAVWIGFLTYNSLIVVQILNGSPAQAGLLAAIGSVTYASAATQTGRISDIFASRFYILLVSQILISGGLVIVLFADAIVVSSLGIVLLGLGFGTALPIYRSIITGVAPVSLRGGVVSLSESVGRVAATVTPVAMGTGIAYLEPTTGITAALQITGLGLSLVTVLIAAFCLYLGRAEASY